MANGSDLVETLRIAGKDIGLPEALYKSQRDKSPKKPAEGGDARKDSMSS